MERWLVFGRRTQDDNWTSVGAIHAPDAKMAVLLAKESFFRHGEGIDFSVVRATDMHHFEDEELMQPATDKSYRTQAGYAGLGKKRRAVTERIAGAGRAIDRPRPEDKRTKNPQHREKTHE